jgi:DNA-binding PadR family transcriptional regulator
MPREKLSTSEYTVLGIVWRDGPCTTYAVMRELASSASTFYRNRAASTYRVAQRLIGLGLLELDGEEIGSRGDRQIKATEKGYAELQKWLSPPIPKVEVAHTIDLIRLRVHFIAALDGPGRVAFLDDALNAARQRLAELERVKPSPDPFEALGSLGTIYETRARIEWLEQVKKRLPG